MGSPNRFLVRFRNKKTGEVLLPQFSELGLTYGESPDGYKYPGDIGDYLFDYFCWNDDPTYIPEYCLGIADKNGVPLYENDFVKVADRVGKIEYNKEQCLFYLSIQGDNQIIKCPIYLIPENEFKQIEIIKED